MKTDVAVIIVNWNGRKFMEICLPSLSAQTYKNFKTIVVDNGSTDESVEFMKSNFPEVEIISLDRNTGFARANNIGIKKAFEDNEIKYAILLNNDTKLDSRFIDNLIECAKKHPDAGAIQPKILKYDDPNLLDGAGIFLSKSGMVFILGRNEKQNEYNVEQEIFGASATASLFAKEALEKSKIKEGEYFDNDFFAYHEDMDLVLRMKLQGYRFFYAPKAFLRHIHSATARRIQHQKLFYLYRNQILFILKNLPFGIVIRTLLWDVYNRLFINDKRVDKTKTDSLSKSMLLKIVIAAWWSIFLSSPKIFIKRRCVQENKNVANDKIENWLKN